MATYESDSMVLDDDFWWGIDPEPAHQDPTPLESSNTWEFYPMQQWDIPQNGNFGGSSADNQHPAELPFSLPWDPQYMSGSSFNPSWDSQDIPMDDNLGEEFVPQFQDAFEESTVNQNSGLDPLQHDATISREEETLAAQLSSSKKQQRRRITRKQRGVLETWISSHEQPYPTKTEKISLSHQTGMSVAQISGWFTRTRQRKLKRLPITSSLMKPTLPLLDGKGLNDLGKPDVSESAIKQLAGDPSRASRTKSISSSHNRRSNNTHHRRSRSLSLRSSGSYRNIRVIRRLKSQPLTFNLASLSWQIGERRKVQASIRVGLTDDRESSNHSTFTRHFFQLCRVTTFDELQYTHMLRYEEPISGTMDHVNKWLDELPLTENDIRFIEHISSGEMLTSQDIVREFASSSTKMTPDEAPDDTMTRVSRPEAPAERNSFLSSNSSTKSSALCIFRTVPTPIKPLSILSE